MRSVFVFAASEPDVVEAQLDRLSPGQRQPWLIDEALYISRESPDDDFAEVMPALTTALGFRPTWVLTIDVSGRIDGTSGVRRLVSALLEGGGVAMDHYSDRRYTRDEVGSIFAPDRDWAR